MAGVYFHIPFCKSSCGYCNFFKSADLGRVDALVEGMHRELEARKNYIKDRDIRTIYFGGGTPSLCNPKLLRGLVEHLKELFNCKNIEEFTIEVNPDDITVDYLLALREMGVDRLSIGIQSFDDAELRVMNRRHSSSQAVEAVRLAQSLGFDNITIDLIFGVDGFGGDCLKHSLEMAISLGVQHISAYHLTIEPNTAFGRRVAKGEFAAVVEQVSSDEYLMVHDYLVGAGFDHYEVSNYALSGFRAKHNSAYWSGAQYLGIGPSAHSFNGENRHWAVASIDKYIDELAFEEEDLSESEHFNEYIMTSLRVKEGVDLRFVRDRFGSERYNTLIEDVQRYLSRGVVKIEEEALFISPKDFLISDSIIADLFQLDQASR